MTEWEIRNELFEHSQLLLCVIETILQLPDRAELNERVHRRKSPATIMAA